jgi:hypothetical protein
MLSANMLSANMLSANMLSANMLSANMLSANMLSTNILSVKMQSVIMLSVEVGIVYSFRLISSTGNQLKPGHVGSEKMSQLVAQLNLSEKGKKKKFLNSKDKSKEKYFF